MNYDKGCAISRTPFQSVKKAPNRQNAGMTIWGAMFVESLKKQRFRIFVEENLLRKAF